MSTVWDRGGGAATSKAAVGQERRSTPEEGKYELAAFPAANDACVYST